MEYASRHILPESPQFSFREQLRFGGLAVQTLCNVNGSESFGSNTTFGGNPTVPVDVGASDIFWQVTFSRH